MDSKGLTDQPTTTALIEQDNTKYDRSSFDSSRSDISIMVPDNSNVVSVLKKVTLICILFMVVELIGGYWANSVAVISDALHVSIDIVGYIIQIISARLATKSMIVLLRKYDEYELWVLQVRAHWSYF